MSGEAALTFLLQQVTEVLRDYKDLKDGEKYELGQLENELRLMKAFLKDSAKKSEKEKFFREKERQIRELVYDIEDTIEICLTKTAAAENKNIVRRWFQTLSSDMAQQVKLLRKRSVIPMMDELRKFNGKEVGDGSSKSLGEPRTEIKMDQSMGEPSVTFIHDQSTGQQFVTNPRDESVGQPSSQEQSNKQDGVVDFEEEATIIGHLMESKDELDVISISGMAGLGKTTLAWKIFQNEEIRRKFPLRIWIRVSQKFNSTDVFLEILKGFTTSSSQGMPIPRKEDLIPTVRKCLEKNEFLLVMDDVWDVQDWKEIEEILPKKNGTGKVLVTSRHEDVANQASVPLHLNPLGSQKSLQLLKLKVFGNVEDFPPELEDVGQAIANKCRGVPLIIVVIGGFLKLAKRGTAPGRRDKWLDVLNDVNKILQKEISILNALELSYNILSDDLRSCFLYTGLFPKNLEIPASTLTQLWIAEGFIQREDGRNFEQSAEKILDDLINMNLLLARKKNLDRVKTCGVHDMVRKFCKAKAMNQNLFRVMKSNDGVFKPPVSEVENFRRLCLHSDPINFLSGNPKGPRVRSFLCFSDEPLDLAPKHTSTIPGAFNLLRVLSCKSITFQQFPEVTKLYLLKHISLSVGNLNVLPRQISQLVNLQTLIVMTNSRSIAVKANIWKMIQLRRLKTKATISLKEKKWKGKASENLQTISRLSPESCKPELSKRAPCLKTLGIQGKLANLFNNFSLEEFRRLEKLKLVNDLGGEPPSNNPLLRLPQSAHFPQNFKRLTLSKTYLEWDRHMPILAQINTLKVLKLKDNAFTGDFWLADKGNGFRELQFLLIENSKLVIWNASTAHFPSLTSLVLKKCKHLEKIPECLAENLEKLEIEGVKISAAQSAREIESNIKQAEERGKAKWRAPFKLTVGPDCDS